MRTSRCQSLFGCIYLCLLFHVVVKSAKRTYQNVATCIPCLAGFFTCLGLKRCFFIERDFLVKF